MSAAERNKLVDAVIAATEALVEESRPRIGESFEEETRRTTRRIKARSALLDACLLFIRAADGTSKPGEQP